MRLTYRTVRVLTFIGEHPGASNREIAEGSGIADQGQISKLLTRLARLRAGAQHRGRPGSWAPPTSGTSPTAAVRWSGPRARGSSATDACRMVPLKCAARSEQRKEMLARLLLWRLLGVVALLVGVGGARVAAARRHRQRRCAVPRRARAALPRRRCRTPRAASRRRAWRVARCARAPPARRCCSAAALARCGRRRRYVRLRVEPYRTDRASAEAVVAMYEALHKRLLRRWWRRLLHGQPSVALEVHHIRAGRRSRQGAGSRSRVRWGWRGWWRRRCAAPTRTAAWRPRRDARVGARRRCCA